MPMGRGEYDDLCTYARKQAKARSVVLIVLDGEKGAGFSVQADLTTILGLPEILESIAAQMRNDFRPGH